MKRMPFQQNVKVVKGWIPESFTGIDDKFCFVNLDLDLYQPMLENLKFFWDKMVQGGVILCYDYYNPELPGVKQAIDDFEKHVGRVLPKYPLYKESNMAVLK